MSEAASLARRSFLVVNAFEEDRAGGFESAMNDFLIKPFDPENLFSILLKWMDRRPV